MLLLKNVMKNYEKLMKKLSSQRERKLIYFLLFCFAQSFEYAEEASELCNIVKISHIQKKINFY